MNLIREYRNVNISEIINYSENPRHEIGTNENDTIRKLINKVGSQYMYNLAVDIYRNGLLGANLPTLVFDNDSNKYVVYEGNRRIACVKFLNNPSILSSIDKALKQRIEKLKKIEEPKYSSNIYCLITSEKEAYKIMERTHSGEDKGRGLKAWTPKEKSVFDSRLKNTVTIELVIADQYEKYFKEDVTKKISYTTIQRFFNNREVKKTLNIYSDYSNVTKEKIVLIKYLIDEAIKESEKNNVSLTRLFNRAREIEDFFVPLIKKYRGEIDSSSNDFQKKTESHHGLNLINTSNGSTGTTTGFNGEKTDGKQDISMKLYLNKKIEKEIFFSDQTINLSDQLHFKGTEGFNHNFISIKCRELNIIDGIIQPNNLPGKYKIIFRYCKDEAERTILWQDSLTVSIQSRKISYSTQKQKTILPTSIIEKYYDHISFEHGEKLISLMLFLANEEKDGKYSTMINIASRMFLEYLFRMYASKVLKEDNHTIDRNSKSLQSFIDSCCSKIEQSEPRKFVKHIQRGRKDATNKIDLLQKSIHHFEVTISNEDVQIMFSNLNIYLEHILDKIIEESLR